jgi:hypothetical protein
MAGLAFRRVEVLRGTAGEGVHRLWVPLLDGVERLGVAELVLPEEPGREQEDALRAFVTLVAELIVARDAYSDVFSRLRRRRTLSLAAEMQWELLPPLSFGTDRVVITGGLEPAYDIGGDSFDYAVNGDTAELFVLDSVGHGLPAAVLASVAISAYRHARRNAVELPEIAGAVNAVIAGQLKRLRNPAQDIGAGGASAARCALDRPARRGADWGATVTHSQAQEGSGTIKKAQQLANRGIRRATRPGTGLTHGFESRHSPHRQVCLLVGGRGGAIAPWVPLRRPPARAGPQREEDESPDRDADHERQPAQRSPLQQEAVAAGHHDYDDAGVQQYQPEATAPGEGERQHGERQGRPRRPRCSASGGFRASPLGTIVLPRRARPAATRSVWCPTAGGNQREQPLGAAKPSS